MTDSTQDLLGSALSSSFTLPPPAPRPTPTPALTQVLNPEKEETSAEEMEDWKPEYEARLAHWQAEASEARSKAEATRARIEKEREDELKVIKNKSEDEKKRLRSIEEGKKREEKLRLELEEGVGAGQSKKGDGKGRGEKVREAWELVGGRESREVVTDGRGVVGGDIGQTSVPGQKKESFKGPMYDPTTSTDPLPPYLQNPTSSTSTSKQNTNLSLSQSATTTSTWENISGTPSSIEDLSPDGQSSPDTSDRGGQGQGRGDELLSVNESSNIVGRGLTDPVPRGITTSGLSPSDFPGSNSNKSNLSKGQSKDNNPPQPPSLTLSLFTLPSHLSLTRVAAVVGINFILPFINGVMLGFGEIFARETVKVGRLFWRGERAVFGWKRGAGGDDVRGGARGVGSVGLSGSGGFP